MLKDKKHIHFIGIGGIGMSGIASYLHEKGYVVSGSDLEESVNTLRLISQGINVSIGHGSQNIANPDLVVYSAAISDENQELVFAKRQNIETISRADMLGKICKLTKFSIAVSGTHGKTSTTSILGFVMKEAGLNPVIISGGIMKDYNSNFISGGDLVTIVEADEYNKSFLSLHPDFAILTNVDTDHLECYENEADLQKNFIQFANQVKTKVVLCNDEKDIEKIATEIKTNKVFYSVENSGDLSATNIEFSEGKTTFNLDNVNFEIPLLGIHNVRNTLAAIAIAKEFDIELQKISDILKNYNGVKRRFEIIHQDENNIYVDDYAHHPEEIQKTILGAKNAWKSNKLLVIFQPHLYSRTKYFYKEFAQALCHADKIVVTDIYPAREKPMEGVSGRLIFDELSNLRQDNIAYADKESKWVEKLLALREKNDIVLSFGAGDINKVHKMIINR